MKHKNITNNSHLPTSLSTALSELEETATQIQAEVTEIADWLLLPLDKKSVPVPSLLQNLLYPLLDCIRQVLKVDTATVLLCSEDKQDLIVQAACGLEEEVAAGIHIPIGYGFAGKIAAKRELTIVEDLSQVDVFSPILRHKGLQSMVGLPLIVNNQVVGVFHVGTFQSRQFSTDEVQLLKVVAARIGIVSDRILTLYASSQKNSSVKLLQPHQQLVSFQCLEIVKFLLSFIELSNLEYSIV